MGMFYRTIRMVDNGIKPVYVFDGKPPQMKGGELLKRAEKREKAQEELAKAEAEGLLKLQMNTKIDTHDILKNKEAREGV